MSSFDGRRVGAARLMRSNHERDIRADHEEGAQQEEDTRDNHRPPDTARWTSRRPDRFPRPSGWSGREAKAGSGRRVGHGRTVGIVCQRSGWTPRHEDVPGRTNRRAAGRAAAIRERLLIDGRATLATIAQCPHGPAPSEGRQGSFVRVLARAGRDRSAATRLDSSVGGVPMPTRLPDVSRGDEVEAGIGWLRESPNASCAPAPIPR